MEQLSKKPAIIIEEGTKIYQLLNASSQGFRILFVPAYVVAVGAVNDKVGIKDKKSSFL